MSLELTASQLHIVRREVQWQTERLTRELAEARGELARLRAQLQTVEHLFGRSAIAHDFAERVWLWRLYRQYRVEVYRAEPEAPRECAADPLPGQLGLDLA